VKVFVTVGSMLPFDRLLKAADDWAATHPQIEVRAQIGEGAYQPKAMKAVPMMAPEVYRQCCAEADVIVSHVGMGTAITAAEVHRPLVALARRPDFGEVTSDHQLATARWLGKRPGVFVIEDASELGQAIEQAARGGAAMQDLSHGERDRLIACIKNFIEDSVYNVGSKKGVLK